MDTIDLPAEYRFDVPRAVKSLETLAEQEPDALIAVTLAQFDSGGMGAESDVRLKVSEAAALLATVGEDQRLKAGPRDLIVLRVVRVEQPPTNEITTSDEWG